MGQQLEDDADLVLFQPQLFAELFEVAAAEVLEVVLEEVDGHFDVWSFCIHLAELEEHILLEAAAAGAHGLELSDQVEGVFELVGFDPDLAFE